MQEYLTDWLDRCYGLKVPSCISILRSLLGMSPHIRLISSDGMFGLQNCLLITYERNKLKNELEGPITSWERALKHAGCYVLRTTHNNKEKWWCVKGSDKYFQPSKQITPAEEFVLVEPVPIPIEEDIYDLVTSIASGTQLDRSSKIFAAGIKYISSVMNLPAVDVPDEWYEDKRIAKREILESVDEIFAILPQKRVKKY